MPRRLTLLLLTALFMGSCAPATASLTPPVTATVTQTVSPPQTPTASPSPTSTPMPQTREHLLITRDHEHWAVINADGSLQRYIQVPDLADPSDVSPDGNWLDYESGSYEDEPYDLSLNLLNLDDGTSRFVTNLLSPDFPQNIEPIVESTSQYQSLYGDDCPSLECRRSRIKDDIAISAGISRWSPDGKLLAFAAQIDGPSTDIYVYNMQDKTTQRLTDDMQTIYRMEWSPDSKKILYINNIPGISVFGETFHIIDLEGNTFQVSLEILPSSEAKWMQIGWISNNLYLFQALYYEHPQFRQLALLNTENGQVTEIWPYNVEDFKIDMNDQTVVLLFESKNKPNLPESGVYRVSANGDYKKISSQMFYRLTGSSQIVGEGIQGGVETAYHVKNDNSIVPIGPALSGHSDISDSPDKKWFFVDDFYEGDQRLTVYSNTYQLVKSWMFDEYLIQTSWRPDSLGIFLFTSDNIYYLAIPYGEPQLLNVNISPWLLEGCNPVVCTWPSFAWLP